MLNRCGNRKYTRGISVNKLKRGCAFLGGGGRGGAGGGERVCPSQYVL